MPTVAREDSNYQQDWSRLYRPKRFFEVEHEVYRHHANALEKAGIGARRAWRHSGGTDLVSFLCHHGEPDWLSLTVCRIDSRESAYTLAEVASAQREWSAGEHNTMFWAGPYPPTDSGTVGRLEDALGQTVVAIGAGVAGNAAYEILKQVLGR